jgi:hypothetical protein
VETVSRADAERNELWTGSVQAYNARRTAYHREQWIEFYRCMERLHRNLAAEHQRKAVALMRHDTTDDD